MKHRIPWSLAALSLVGTLALLYQPLQAQTKAKATNVPVIPHEAVPNFFKNPPGIYTGENMGIATNSKGNIYIYHRANETRLFEYTPAGHVRPRDRPQQLRLRLRPLGARRRAGQHLGGRRRHRHARQVQPRGQGADDDRPPRGPGRRRSATCPGQGVFHGRNEKYRFGRETDVAWDQQGNIFVSDGYFDARVVKFDKNGRFVKAVGKRGTGNLEFNTPHSIATDFQGNVYVGDRGNARVQVLDNDLNWKANYTERRQPVGGVRVGRPRPEEPRQAVPLRRRTRGRTARRRRGAEFTGEVYKMELDGTIIGKFGKGGKAVGEFATIHQMDCRDPNVIYTAEINNWRSQKILLKPQRRRQARARSRRRR